MENQEEKKCPKCNAAILKTRSKRPFLVKYLLFWLPIKRFKCDMCNKKSYLFGTYSRKKTAWV